MTALLLTLALLTPARADDLSLRVGIGWVEESAAAAGVLSARRNPVALLDADWSRKRLQIGLDLRAAFGSRVISGVTGAALGELERFRGGFSVGYRLGSDWTIEYAHRSDHAQPAALFRATFYDLEQANSIVLWRRLR